MKIEVSAWEEDGKETGLCRYTVTNQEGNSVTLCNLGAAVTSLVIRDREGIKRDVVLGYRSPGEYRQGGEYLGACVGRFGGWIKDGRITVGGKEYQLYRNDGKNHLHGGKNGFDQRVWQGKAEEGRVTFRRVSPDGEEGYPGELRAQVTYEFTENSTLRITYDAVCDADTICNLTNHSYFNLNGEREGDILGHRLWIGAELFNDNDQDGISCLGMRPVAHTPFDFRIRKRIGAEIRADCEQLRFGCGYDHNYYLGGSGEMRLAAVLSGDQSRISMEVRTDQSGLQLYTGNYLGGRRGKSGARYEKYAGVCLETQFCASAGERERGVLYPLLKKGEAYHYGTEYHFAVD